MTKPVKLVLGVIFDLHNTKHDSTTSHNRVDFLTRRSYARFKQISSSTWSYADRLKVPGAIALRMNDAYNWSLGPLVTSHRAIASFKESVYRQSGDRSSLFLIRHFGSEPAHSHLILEIAFETSDRITEVPVTSLNFFVFIFIAQLVQEDFAIHKSLPRAV